MVPGHARMISSIDMSFANMDFTATALVAPGIDLSLRMGSLVALAQRGANLLSPAG